VSSLPIGVSCIASGEYVCPSCFGQLKRGKRKHIVDEMASTAKRVKKRCIDALEDSKYYTLLNHLLGIPAGKKTILRFIKKQISKEVGSIIGNHIV
jgi:hypothetical protein